MPNLLDPLFTDFAHERHFLLVIPLVLGILLFSRFFPKGDWLSRWSLALILGVSRTALAMARDGYLPAALAVHPRGVPVRAELAVGTLSG